MKLTRELAEQAIWGGAFLAGGGGGDVQQGMYILDEVMKMTDSIEVLPIEDFKDEDIVLTASVVGAPSAKERYVDKNHWLEIYRRYCLVDTRPLAGIISNENGGMATTNGWLLAAAAKLPIIDAPCNGRAQPYATMASMRLALEPDYHSIQVCAGGKGDRNMMVVSEGKIDPAGRVVRQTAVHAGGFVAVVRNPVTIEYLKKNGAIGGLTYTLPVGELFVKYMNRDVDALLYALKECMGAQVVCKGVIKKLELVCENGFDRGLAVVEQEGRQYEITYWNEYMTLECDGERIGSYPDLLATIDAKTGEPLPSAALKEGREIYMLYAPKQNLKLGSGMFVKEFYHRLEESVQKDIISYSFPD